MTGFGPIALHASPSSQPPPRGIPPAGRFALCAALCSSFGQTFFIGLFGAEFRSDFSLTESTLGLIYGLATLVSGVLMFWLGAIADHWSLRRVAVLAMGLLAGGALMIGLGDHLVLLLAGLFLVRLAGQGMSGHLAVVAAGRYAVRRRGRAMAMATYGFIIGEALFPVLVAWAMGWTDWRGVWLMASAMVVILALPLLIRLASPLVGSGPGDDASEAADQAPTISRAQLFRDGRFLRVLAVVLIPPLVVTATFLHQGTLAERLGWGLGDVASGFVLFAAIQGVFAFAGGRLIDRFSARALLRFSLLPACVGLLALSLTSPEAALWLMFAGLGMTAGLNGVTSGAVWAELFGTAQLGLIRGVYSALMVVSTAIGPVIVGLLFDWQVSLLSMAIGYTAYALVVPFIVVPGILGFGPKR